MSSADLQLAEDEEVLFEESPAVLTSRRLMVHRTLKGEPPGWEKYALDNISLLKKKNGGNESRLELGLKLGAAGIVFILLELTLTGRLPELLDVILFLLGATGFLAGMYLLVSSILGTRPYTAVSIVILGERDKVFFLPGHDNPAADTVIQRFAQARRRLTSQESLGVIRRTSEGSQSSSEVGT